MPATATRPAAKWGMESRVAPLVVVPLVVEEPDDVVVPLVPLLALPGTTVVAWVAADWYFASEREELAAVLGDVSAKQKDKGKGMGTHFSLMTMLMPASQCLAWAQ